MLLREGVLGPSGRDRPAVRRPAARGRHGDGARRVRAWIFGRHWLICSRRNVPIEALGTFFGPKGKPVVRDLQAERVFPDFTFGTHLCDLEVDLDTGKVQLLRYVAAHDVGRAINPRSVEGQISGAVVQGLGMALLEEVVFGPTG